MDRRRILAPLAAALLLGGPALAAAQSAAPPAGAPVNPVLLRGAWKASWIAAPGASEEGFGVYHFRRTLQLPAKPASFIVHISADNRYRLLVNGTQVSSGPQRGDRMHWHFESVDLAPYLRPGRNVLAALVWNYGALRPVAQITNRTGFILQGDGEPESVANTGAEWRALRDSAYAGLRVTAADVDGYYAAAPGEAVDARRYPWGWEGVDYDDSAWPAAVSIGPGQPRGVQPYGEAGGWQLIPRTLPPMEETEQRLTKVARAEGAAAGGGAFLQRRGDLVVPAHSTATLLLDQGFETNAYPVLEASGGAGTTLTLTYAEALLDAQGRKGNRNEIEGKTIKGYHDVITLDGGAHRRFRSLSFRTFRYLQLQVRTGDEPARIHDLHGIFTGYPFQERARFDSDLPWLHTVWEIDWRTARLDAWETYFDCPYYEQLQYAGDTRIQGLISLYMAGDDRLAREALVQFDRSRIPEGITASRYPSNLTQLIPPFSLLWVGMVHDYWMNRDDPTFVRQFLPGIHSVLGWYERRLDARGLVGAAPWWNFADWAYTHAPFVRGVPPGGDEGGSTLITLQFLDALQHAAELADSLGAPEDAAHYRAVARRVADGVRSAAWDAGRGLFADSPARAVFSQHTNSLAVLTGLVPPAEQGEVMRKVISDSSLVQAGYYFQFYVNEALARAGEGDRYIERLAPWRGMLDLGLTTVPETPEPTRSDSHAWSAHPNYGMLSIILGVRPASPGFRSVRIAPALGPLRRAEGSVPHPRGDIVVKLERTGDSGVRATITLPPGLPGTFVWQGREVALHAGEQTLTM
jgi:hypothetical protein